MKRQKNPSKPRRVVLCAAYFNEDGAAFTRIIDNKWLSPDDALYVPWHKFSGKKIRLIAEVLK